MEDFKKNKRNKLVLLLLSASIVVFVASIFGKIDAAPPPGDPGTTSGIIKSDGTNLVISGNQNDSTLNNTRVLIIASTSAVGHFPFKIFDSAEDSIFSIDDAGFISIATSTHPTDPNIPVMDIYSNIRKIYVNGTTVTDVLRAYNISAKGTIQADGGFIGIASQVPAGNVSAGIFGSNYGYGNFAFGTSTNLGVGTSTQVGLPQRLSVYGGGYFSGRVGISTSTTNPEFALSVGDGGGIIAKGSGGPTLTTTGAGTRLIWYPAKSAFRAGMLTGPGSTSWDNANVGVASFAAGSDTMASGAFGATALGLGTLASGDFGSIALGFSSRATGDTGSFAAGNTAVAEGNSSVAIGNQVRATGQFSIALGSYVSVKDNVDASIVMGSGVFNSSTKMLVAELSNNSTGSLAIGFNSDIPTFVVTRSAGVGTTGNVGIGLTNPQNKLSVSGGDMQLVSPGSGIIFSDGTKQTTAANPGNGSNGRMAFWNSSTTLGSNSNFVWDNANTRMSIGFNAPVAPYSLYTAGPIRSNSGISRFDGDLQVKSTGFLQFEKTQNGAPVASECDSDSERGRFLLDIANNRLYVCNGVARGWDYLTLTN
jgi:hypothetical protein